ncbi:class I adenylate-forming enzyme family protein [Thermomonospora amylolytica]|uniref:class I adenylate-forming enzyme family protein n=1 Tax=Thermomonospora amylolytica TaxID=1411117 RepID=UPI000E6D105B|nr:AMP-binding protein [Thermomonospora amylolytica]
MARPVPSPGTPAAYEGDAVLTHGQWREQANRLASALAERGVGKGDRVAVRMHNRLEWLVVGLALGKLGAVQVAVNYRLAPPETEHILKDCRVRAAIVDDEDPTPLRDAWKHLDLNALIGVDRTVPGVERLDDLIGNADEGEWPPGGLAPLVIYSSGTTGRPKGAPLGGWNTRPDPEVLADYLRSVGFDGASGGPGNRTMVTLPLHHAAGPGSVRAALRTGGTVYFLRRFDPEAALALIERRRITHWGSVPTMLQRIMKLPEEVRRRYDVSSLRYLSTGAAPVPQRLKEQVLDHFGEILYEGYGCTEAGMITGCTPADHRRKPGSSGRPFRHVRIRILGEDGRALPPGRTGEIAVRTPVVISGYIGRGRLGPDQLDADGFYRTGDIGHLDADGYLYISDRRTDMIISGGANIYPAEIEAVLTEHPAVAVAAVIGVPDPDAGERPIALVERQPGAEAGAEDLLEHCRGRLARYKWPRRIEFVDQIPVNPMGKIEKRRLREPYWRGHERRI